MGWLGERQLCSSFGKMEGDCKWLHSLSLAGEIQTVFAESSPVSLGSKYSQFSASFAVE